MKQTIFNASSREEIITRIKKLNADTHGRWGKLTAPQMIRHLTEGCRLAFDEIKVPDQSNFITRTLVKWLFLKNVKPPGREKGNIKTFAEINVVDLGIVVSDIDTEKEKYIEILQRMNNTVELSHKHPLFGKMSRSDWGYLTYAHADYHLTQFNL